MCMYIQLRRYSTTSSSNTSPLPRRSSSLAAVNNNTSNNSNNSNNNDNNGNSPSTRKSSVTSLFSRTRNVARLGKRSVPPTSSASNADLYEEDENGESEPKSPRLTYEYFKRYELMTEL